MSTFIYHTVVTNLNKDAVEKSQPTQREGEGGREREMKDKIKLF